jgi:hypothetical protein
LPAQVELKTSVASRDGTQINVLDKWVGPPLVPVHGAPADHRPVPDPLFTPSRPRL